MHVISVSQSATHGFSKNVSPFIQLISGHGVEGDAHAGATTQHLYRQRKTPKAPNLTQVHLLQSELFAELLENGIILQPGQLGENITTVGIDLLHLPVGTRLFLGATAVVQVTGLREPCRQMNALRPGLMKACLGLTADGQKIRRAGVMGIAIATGTVVGGDKIRVELPALPHRSMGPV